MPDAQIEAEIAEFLAKGGRIKQLREGESAARLIKRWPYIALGGTEALIDPARLARPETGSNR